MRELSTRDYLYRDEIDARLELADTAGTATCFDCLPGVIKRDYSNKSNKEAFTEIAILLMALPGSVYSRNLLEFLFEYHEDHGRANFRQDWYRARM